MEYNNDWKVEFQLLGSPWEEFRRVNYRIKPSELTWWQQLFCNNWKSLFHAYDHICGVSRNFDKERYYKEIVPLKTYGDVDRYLREQSDKITINRAHAISRGDIWPDKYEIEYNEIITDY